MTSLLWPVYEELLVFQLVQLLLGQSNDFQALNILYWKQEVLFVLFNFKNFCFPFSWPLVPIYDEYLQFLENTNSSINLRSSWTILWTVVLLVSIFLSSTTEVTWLLIIVHSYLRIKNELWMAYLECSIELFLPCYSSERESQPCGDVWGQDKLCRTQGQGCVYYIGGTPNAKVSCPFLVCSAWEGREGILMPGAVVVELAFAFLISSFLPADTQRWSRDASGRFALRPFCVLSSPTGCPLLFACLKTCRAKVGEHGSLSSGSRLTIFICELRQSYINQLAIYLLFQLPF